MAQPLAQFEQATRDQIAAAVSQVLAARFAEVGEAQARESARLVRTLSERYNQVGRRLQIAETPAEWTAILTEAAQPFASRVRVLFPGDRTVREAPACANVIESRETVVTAREESQLPAGLLPSLGASEARRCYLIPVFGRPHPEPGRRPSLPMHGEPAAVRRGTESESVVAILYAEPGANPVDRNALELLAQLAWGTLPPPPPPAPAPGLIQIGGRNAAAAPATVPESDAARHYAAQRFARVRVAELLVHEKDKVYHGRKDRRLYQYLKDPIDSGRREFRSRFVESCPSMADYFHMELVHTLAHDQAETMGTEYPGAVVL